MDHEVPEDDWNNRLGRDRRAAAINFRMSTVSYSSPDNAKTRRHKIYLKAANFAN
jgi:hypothetical protein